MYVFKLRPFFTCKRKSNVYMRKLTLKIMFVWLLLLMAFSIFVDYFTHEAKFKFGTQTRLSEDSYDNLNDFYKIHEQMAAMNVSMRKISFNVCINNGYGNRLYSFLTSFFIALLTNSQLVVRWKEIEPYVDLPIRVFDYNLTYDQGLEREMFAKNFLNIRVEKVNLSQCWSRTKNIDMLMKTTLPESSSFRYLYQETCPFFMELCSNPIYFNRFTHYNLVKNETINSALEVISNKESTHVDKQEKLFKIGYEVGGNLLNRVWRPNKLVRDDVKRFYEKYFQNNFVIGFQLRYAYLHQQDTKTFIKCALDIENKYLAENKSLTISSFKWFIASDSQNEINEILKTYPNKTFTTSEYTLAHTVLSQEGYHRAMLDVELLSRCNEIIVTGGSTFGWVSAMKSLRLPLYINGPNRMDTCLRTRLSDPPAGGQGPFASF